MKTEYQLFLCDISGDHAPVAVFVSETPFPYFAVGDRFDDEGWQRIDGTILGSEKQPIRFTIHSIKHVIKVEGDQNIVQTGLNLKPFTGRRSPAFDTEVMISWREALQLSIQSSKSIRPNS